MAPVPRAASWRPGLGAVTSGGNVRWPSDPLTGVAESIQAATMKGRKRWPPVQMAYRSPVDGNGVHQRRVLSRSRSVGSHLSLSQEKRETSKSWRDSRHHFAPVRPMPPQRTILTEEGVSTRSTCKRPDMSHPPPWSAGAWGLQQEIEYDNLGDGGQYYDGWPTSGPSQDKMLLKMRAASRRGHVNWKRWALGMEPFDDSDVRRSLSMERTCAGNLGSSTLATSELSEAGARCPNYGVVGDDGSVTWPAPWGRGVTDQSATVKPSSGLPHDPAFSPTRWTPESASPSEPAPRNQIVETISKTPMPSEPWSRNQASGSISKTPMPSEPLAEAPACPNSQVMHSRTVGPMRWATRPSSGPASFGTTNSSFLGATSSAPLTWGSSGSRSAHVPTRGCTPNDGAFNGVALIELEFERLMMAASVLKR